jgi:hypothetical protein
MYWFTHTHPGTHPCVCMYVCAPCPPRPDSPLAPPMRQDEATPLYISAQNGHTDTVLALLQAGATVDAKDEVQGAVIFFVNFRFSSLGLRLGKMCVCVCVRVCVYVYIYLDGETEYEKIYQNTRDRVSSLGRRLGNVCVCIYIYIFNIHITCALSCMQGSGCKDLGLGFCSCIQAKISRTSMKD